MPLLSLQKVPLLWLMILAVMLKEEERTALQPIKLLKKSVLKEAGQSLITTR